MHNPAGADDERKGGAASGGRAGRSAVNRTGLHRIATVTKAELAEAIAAQAPKLAGELDHETV